MVKFKYNCVLIPNLVVIHSNCSKIHYFSFGEIIEPNLFNNTPCKYDLIFDIKPRKYFAMIKDRNFEYEYSDSIRISLDDEINLIYNKNIGITKIFMYISMSGDTISVFVDKLYYLLFKLKVENILPPGVHLRDLLYMKLVFDKYIPLHSASFAINKNNGFLILAPPNTGKSLTVSLLANNGFKVLSEDIAVLDLEKLEIYSAPYTATMLHELSKLKYLPLLSYYLPKRLKSFGEIFKKNLIPRAKLKKIFILEKSKGKEEKRKKDYLVKILNLTRNEFNIRSNPVINSILYYLRKDIESYEYDKIYKLVNKVDVIILRAKDPFEYYNMLVDML